MTRLIIALLLVSSSAHAALRSGNAPGTTPRPTTPPVTNPTPAPLPWPITGGGSPTTTCLIYPLSCVQ
jgi:hypothetical protein